MSKDKAEVRFFEGDWIYDIETFRNCFTFCLVRADGKNLRVFEISDRKNETEKFLDCLRWLVAKKQRLVGFNNLGFDYPIIHDLLTEAIRAKRLNKSPEWTAQYIYKKAQLQIDSFKDGFGHTIPSKDAFIPQLDLYKINHFDNKAKATSLKMLEFNMRSDTIEDLPYSHDMLLDSDGIDKLIQYNKHDVIKTLEFYYECYDEIALRKDLSEKLGIDFTNHNDTKIGKDYFIKMLEEQKPGTCYKMVGEKRVIRRTPRSEIDLGDCLFDYYDFKRPEFVAIKNWFASQVITETKGVFTEIEEHRLGDVAKFANMRMKREKFKTEPTEKDVKEFLSQYPLGEVDKVELKAKKKGQTQYSYWKTWKIADALNVVINDFQFDFGVGGIHGSVAAEVVEADGDDIIKDADVSSMYPNLAIANRVYPEHLGENFCDIYEDVYERRKSYPKGSTENKVMKLALNGVYGDSNNQYSPFYDPKYTMTITINGQLSICLLAERLMTIPNLKIIQVNTDGITCKFNKKYAQMYDDICKGWEKTTGLQLEFADYSKMIIRDVNNYIAVYTNGKLKRKGAYQYEELGWHQNQSSLVIPKAVEAFFINNTPIEEFIKNHDNKWDFMLRTKVPRSSKLVMVLEDGYEVPLQNTCRYYACEKGGTLVKLMPPTPKMLAEGVTDFRRIGIDKQWKVKPCNNMVDFTGDINYNYYIEEAKKLASLMILDEELSGGNDND